MTTDKTQQIEEEGRPDVQAAESGSAPTAAQTLLRLMTQPSKPLSLEELSARAITAIRRAQGLSMKPSDLKKLCERLDDLASHVAALEAKALGRGQEVKP